MLFQQVPVRGRGGPAGAVERTATLAVHPAPDVQRAPAGLLVGAHVAWSVACSISPASVNDM